MNFTALLLVLTLTGSPVVGVVCVTDCQHEPAAATHCHGDMAASDGPMMSASVNCNDPSISERPYVTEHRFAPDVAVLTTTLLSTPLEEVRVDTLGVPARGADAWLKPPLVLRI